MKYFKSIILIFVTVSLCSLVWAQESSIPEDIPVTAEIIHKRKFIYEGRSQLGLDSGYLFGDKFANTKSVLLSYKYYFSNQFGFELRYGKYFSQVTDEVQQLSQNNPPPRVYDPSWTASASALYQPIYGKFLLGSSIYHLSWGFKAGLSYFGLKELGSGGDTPAIGTYIGPLVGTYILIPFENNFVMNIFGELSWQPKMTDIDTTGGNRQLVLFGLGVGYQL